MGIIAPSILSADFTKLGKELEDIENAGADWVHIDVMDGQFVPNITYGPIIVDACKRACNLTLDVHLMIEKPDLLIPEFAKAGAHYICVHQEACTHLHRSLQLIKSLGVNPGFGGQNFIESSLDKIKALASLLKEKNSNAIIQVDGGINKNTIKSVSQAGASAFVAGSAIYQQPGRDL